MGSTLAAMLYAHGLIGIGEAAITGVAVSVVLSWQPGLLHSGHLATRQPLQTGNAVLAIALAAVILVGVAPLASSLPDGLEGTLQLLGHDASPAVLSAPMAGYRLPGMNSSARWSMVPGLTGVLALLGAAMLISSASKRYGSQ